MVGDLSITEVTKLLPVLIAAATMLAMVNLRNSDLATRFRNNVTETRKKDTSSGRRHNLRFQNLLFFLRYIITSATFICLAFSMTCFAIYGLTALAPTTNDELAALIESPIRGWFGLQFHYQEVFTLRTGMSSFLYGLGALTFEFLIGFITLVLDGYSSLGRAE